MEKIQNKILSFLRTGQGDFASSALELFAYQFTHNAPYQAFCRLQGKTPETASHWEDIPAVSVDAFKSAELTTFPIGRAAAHFQSSGTTRQVRSHHYLKTLSYYEASLLHSFSQAIQPESSKPPFLILAPSPAEQPRSSLSWMFDVARRAYAMPGSPFLVKNGRLDELWLSTLLKKYEATKQPVVLLGTTIAFAAFFDHLKSNHFSFRLANGSRLMDTGGMKTEKRELSRPEFVRSVAELLGIPEGQCINEYGMCELSSQFYGSGSSSYLEGPPWVRTLAIDPQTGSPVTSGKPGLLRHFDLANVDSVLAIQTEDVGVVVQRPTSDVGRRTSDGFVLQGRDPGADVRGCSISAEAFLSK